jgi:hypothetical protein
MPSADLPSASIAAYHADMTGVGATTSNIYTGQLNTTTFIIVWEQWQATSSVGTAVINTASTFELVLHASGQWWVNYVQNRYPFLDVTAPRAATVGIQATYYVGTQYCDRSKCSSNTLPSGSTVLAEPLCSADTYQSKAVALGTILAIAGALVGVFAVAGIITCLCCCGCCSAAANAGKRTAVPPQGQQQQQQHPPGTVMILYPGTAAGTPQLPLQQQQPFFQQQQQQTFQNRPFQMVDANGRLLTFSPGGSVIAFAPPLSASFHYTGTTSTASAAATAGSAYNTPERAGIRSGGNQSAASNASSSRPPAYSPDRVASYSNSMDGVPIVEAQYVNDGTIYATAVPMQHR